MADEHDEEGEEEKRSSSIGCKTWAILALIVIAGVTWLVVIAANRVLSLRMGTVHTSELPSPPRFLTDSLATTKATQAIASEGYNMNIWKPVEVSKSSDPDGNSDEHFQR